MPESLRTFLYRLVFNLWPCYRGTGGRVTFIAADWSEVRVRLPLSWRTRNYVGTIFGGSIYAAVDPFFMIMLMHRLGPDYEVWDKAATIRFRKPGRTTSTATLALPPGRGGGHPQRRCGAPARSTGPTASSWSTRPGWSTPRSRRWSTSGCATMSGHRRSHAHEDPLRPEARRRSAAPRPSRPRGRSPSGSCAPTTCSSWTTWTAAGATRASSPTARSRSTPARWCSTTARRSSRGPRPSSTPTARSTPSASTRTPSGSTAPRRASACRPSRSRTRCRPSWRCSTWTGSGSRSRTAPRSTSAPS